jgi:alkylation response protein AidB-like acyl-CoA dehydrogenase
MSEHLHLSEEQAMILETIEKFAQDEVEPGAGERDLERSFPTEVIGGIAEHRLMGVAYPEAIGGAEMGHLTHALVVETLAKACASTAITMVAHSNLALGAVYHGGSPEQHARWGEALCAGDPLGALALGAGAHVAGPTEAGVVATKSGDGWSLSGTASMVINGSRAGLLVVLAATDPDKGSMGLFVVPRDTSGLSCSAPHHTLGLRAADFSDVTFDGVVVPADHVLGDAERGGETVREVLDSARVSMAAIASGVARDALGRSVLYSKERRVFGKRLADFAGTLEKFSNMAASTEGARQLAYAAARAQDAGGDFARIAALAQLHAAKAAHDVAYEALQIFGGYGYCHEYVVERLQRDAKMIEIGIDETAIMRRAAARDLIDA